MKSEWRESVEDKRRIDELREMRWKSRKLRKWKESMRTEEPQKELKDPD